MVQKTPGAFAPGVWNNGQGCDLPAAHETDKIRNPLASFIGRSTLDLGVKTYRSCAIQVFSIAIHRPTEGNVPDVVVRHVIQAEVYRGARPIIGII